MKCIHVVCRMLVFWYFRNKNYGKKHVNTKLYNIECFRICSEVTNILCFSASSAFNVCDCSFPYCKHFNTQKCCFMLLYFSPFTTNKTVCFIQEKSASIFFIFFKFFLLFTRIKGNVEKRCARRKRID